MMLVYEKSRERLNCFNIATPDTSTTVRYIAEAVVRAASPGAKIRYTGGSRGWVGDVPRFDYAIGKVQKLGWSPKMTSDEAVDLAIRENIADQI
jgi:UDP-glucose 4-epimerase